MIKLLIVTIAAVLAWLALDDITTGNEPNYVGEYILLVIALAVIIFLAIKEFRAKKAR